MGKWKTCDSDSKLDEKQCTSKKCACCYPNCCKRSTKCEKVGGFCTSDASVCNPGNTNDKLCKGKGCTCCTMRVCFNDESLGEKSCSALGGQCSTGKKQCKNSGGKYK